MIEPSGEPPEAAALAPVLQAFSPMALHVHRGSGDVVGRPVELAAIGQEIASARTGRLVGLTLEGEPGIGKTRLLLAARELAEQAGFTTIAVTADEELRGPFLVARSILGSQEAVDAAAGGAAQEPLARCLAAMSGQDDPGLASLPSDQRVLRTFDLGAVAFRALAQERGLAILIDDVQWADDDSLRLLRYVVRADAANPILLLFAVRPEEFAFVTEAVNLIADMDRMGVVRRLKVNRFTPAETGAFLGQVLGGPVDPKGASVMHAQAEGVPFMVEEMAFAYREAGMIQQIDGTWTLARNAERLVPSAVKTLISRRAARLPEETTVLLAEAAVLGRHFSLKDLREIEMEVRDVDADPDALTAALAPAVAAGLLVEHGEDSPADYSFPHEQVQEFAMGTLLPARRRAIHAAIVSLLLSGEPAPASLPLLAHHAKAAGDASVCVRFSVAASRNALDANAPEEVLRVVDLSLPLAATPQERVDLLEARDRALEMLRRPDDRMQGLAELAALSEAMADSHLELDVRLRRAAAMRMNEEEDRAAQLAREVVELAASRGDRGSELAACIELGQDLLRSTAGETFVPAAREVDLDGAEQAYARALGIARELDDDAATALVLRELGVIALGRMRDWFINATEAGETLPFAMRVAGGEALDDIMPELPIASFAAGGYRLVRGGAGDLRADRRPSRRDVHDHRDGVPELGAGHPHGYRRRPSHRGDPAAHVPHDGLDHRERSRLGRGADAVRRPRVRAREGDPRSRGLARRGGLPRGERDRRPRPVVPGRRRHGDGVPRPGRAGGRRDVARSRRRGRLGEPHAAAGAPDGDLARRRGGGARRRRRDARASAARGGSGGRRRTARVAVRGAGGARGAVGRAGRRGRATRSCWSSPSGRRTRSSSWRRTCPGIHRGRRRPTRCWRRSRWPAATRAGPRSSRGRRSSGSWRRGRRIRTSRSCCRRLACSARSGRRRPRSRSATWGTTPR